jgi:hypothetical protein
MRPVQYFSLNRREGLEIAKLRRVIGALGNAARECAIDVVAGDTKVVGREVGLLERSDRTAIVGWAWVIVTLCMPPNRRGQSVVVSCVDADPSFARQDGICMVVERSGLTVFRCACFDASQVGASIRRFA